MKRLCCECGGAFKLKGKVHVADNEWLEERVKCRRVLESVIELCSVKRKEKEEAEERRTKLKLSCSSFSHL